MFASEVIKSLLDRYQNKSLKENLEDKLNTDNPVVTSIKSWVKEQLGKVRSKDEKEALQAVIKACSYSHTDTKSLALVSDSIGCSRKTFF